MLNTRHIIGLGLLALGFLIKMLFTHLITFWSIIKSTSLLLLFIGLCFLMLGIFIKSEKIEKGSFKKDPATFLMVSMMQLILVMSVAGFSIVLEHVAEGTNRQITRLIIEKSAHKTRAIVVEERRITEKMSERGYEEFAIFKYENNYGTIEEQGIKLSPKMRRILLRQSINYSKGEINSRLKGQEFNIKYASRFPSMFMIAE